MKQESGRSMIEIVGILAIGVVMIVAAYNMYKSIDQRQKRLIASETIEDAAKKTKVLYEYSGYADASIENLVKSGAISDDHLPVGTGWSIQPENNNKSFRITITGLTYDECEYFLIKKTDWAKVKEINNVSKHCQKNANNEIFFVVD